MWGSLRFKKFTIFAGKLEQIAKTQAKAIKPF
jgi:hypothetical protein